MTLPTGRYLGVVEELFSLLGRADYEPMRELMHQEVEFELPFQLPGHPNRAERLDAVVAFLQSRQLFDRFALHVTSHVELAATSGVLVRYRGDGVVRSTGRPYCNSYVGIFEFRDGQVRRWTEFHNPLVFAEAFGIDPFGRRRSV